MCSTLLTHLLVVLVTSACVLTQTDQQVLTSHEEEEAHAFPHLNFSSPTPLIFHSTFGLLQQWPNTFFEYGHTIAPCTIPKNTNLYHARADASPPPNPEWFAFDVEMSYGIQGALPDSHMLTYRTVKDVKCLYFDGTSASLMREGSMDSQMVFIHNRSANVPDRPRFGEPPPGSGGRYNGTGNWTGFNPIAPEYDRARGLCDFIKEKNFGGLGWGYEGIVRMNAGFELIWCNFTSPSAKLISWLNVSAPVLEDVPSWRPPVELLEEEPSKPPRKGGRGRGSPLPGLNHPFLQRSSVYNWFRAAANRYGFVGSSPGRGETRVKIDTCGIFALYDPALSDQERARVQMERQLYNLTKDGYWVSPQDWDDRAQALMKLGRRRRGQRIVNVSESDGVYMRQAVEHRMRAALEVDADLGCSGIDWMAVTRDVVTDYSVDLYELSSLLSNISHVEDSSVRTWLSYVRDVAHAFYMPYYEYPPFTRDTLDSAFSTKAPQSQAALERCRKQYEPSDTSELSTSENVTYTAILDILSAICSTALPIFISTERTWLAHFNNASTSAPTPPRPVLDQLKRTTHHHHKSIEELMAWLGWVDQWTACSPGCKLGEVCYIPIWPVFGMASFLPGNGTGRSLKEIEEDLWEPKCVVDVSHFPSG